MAERSWWQKTWCFSEVKRLLVLDVVKGHLTEKVKILTYNQNTDLEITMGRMSSQLKFLDVIVNRLFRGWLWPEYRMALIWELLTDQPETQEDHLKHCLRSGLGLFGMTFHQNSLPIFKMCCMSSSIKGCSIVMSCGKKIMKTTLFLVMTVWQWLINLVMCL
jgi:hypothetical protein